MYGGDTTEYGINEGRAKPVPLLFSTYQSGSLFFSALYQQLSDLYRIGSCTLTDLVAAAPQVDAVLIDQISADPSDIYDILI